MGSDLKYCIKVYERNGKKTFWSIKNSGEILNILKILSECDQEIPQSQTAD